MMFIDHVVVAAPDLSAAKREFSEATGVVPLDGGPHPGGGTRNALVSFGQGQYLEIIAPDPEQTLAGTNGERFATLAGTELLHWAVRCDDLESVSDSLAQVMSDIPGQPGPIHDMARDTPEGSRLRWRLMGVRKHDLGGIMPFFIDWQDTPHPSESAPYVGELSSLKLGLPLTGGAVFGPLEQFLGQISDGCLERVASPGMSLEFQSSKGLATYSAVQPAGFRF